MREKKAREGKNNERELGCFTASGLSFSREIITEMSAEEATSLVPLTIEPINSPQSHITSLR